MNHKKLNMLIVSVLSILLVVSVSLTGCGGSVATISSDANLSILGLGEDISIPVNDIYNMQAETKKMKNISPTGEIVEVEVTGVKLDDVLADYNVKQTDFSIIRLIAGDGYSSDVPNEILTEQDIILAYKIDGENLDEKVMPLRSAVGDYRSLYWVSNLMKIELVKNGSSTTQAINTEVVSNYTEPVVNKVMILEPAIRDLENHDYTYYESVDESVKITDLLEKYIPNPAEEIKFIASDDFEKFESLDNFKLGYIKTSGEKVPLFISPDLPKGMQVKNIVSVTLGDTVLLSGEKSQNFFTEKTINDTKGVALAEVVQNLGLTGETYILTAKDGYSAEVSANDLKEGILFEVEPGVYQVKFSEALPKETSVKDIFTIEVVRTESTASSTGSSSEEASADLEKPESSWTITFDGLSDGSFDLASERAKSKFELVTIEAIKNKKDGSEETQSWQGYKLLDALKFLHVEEFNSVTVVSNDGFEKEIAKEQIDDGAILGIMLNGESLADESNLVQFVMKNSPSNDWVKGVAKIIVK